jgi:hypothetical protein
MDKLGSLIQNRQKQHIRIEEDGLYLLDGTGRVYKPSPTGKAFHQSTHLVRHIMGPFGSGKSTICIMDIVTKACAMPYSLDGIRRMRVVAMRNTSPELVTSVVRSWMDWFGGLGTIKEVKKPVHSITHTFNDGKGIIVLEMVFLACDSVDDLKKLKSTEFTMAYLNEVSELPIGLLDVIKGRIGRYPPRHISPEDYWSGVIMDTNPPSNMHWLYDLFEKKRPKNHVLFKQPSGLLREGDDWVTNPEADNIQHLRNNYYVDMAYGAKDDEFIKVYCCGEYGIVRAGKPVYPSYSDNIHSVNSLIIDTEFPIYLGWDFGLTPACLVSQFIGGQWLIIKEFVSDNCSLTDLLTYSVKPWLNIHAKDLKYYSDCDPADKGSDADNVTCRQRLDEAGIPTDKAVTNNKIQRLDAVKEWLGKLVNGKPALAVSREGCPVLREGFLGAYYYRKVNVLSEEKYIEEPYKSHPVSDIHDCAQYTALRLIANTSAPKTPVKSFIDNRPWF